MMPKPVHKLEPFWTTSDGKAVKLYQGDVIEVLRRLPEKSVQMVMTSPPYWGLRDYGTDKRFEIGSEKTPEEYVAKMVEVFREVRRVLRDDGTVWLNLGDTYSGGTTGRVDKSGGPFGNPNIVEKKMLGQPYKTRDACKGIKSGNLVGIPWRVALALQADGWVLRQDIIWAKPSPMPESIKNRCTKAHEYLFLLAKSNKYFFDAEAIREKEKDPGASARVIEYQLQKQRKLGEYGDLLVASMRDWKGKGDTYLGGRNKRSVWTIAPYGYSGAHFATFPPKLVLPCVLAGTSEMGACPKCGAPRRRVTKGKAIRSRKDEKGKMSTLLANQSLRHGYNHSNAKTVGWEATCACGIARSVPCVICDPFVGSGTVCCVAVSNNRRVLGIDLSEEYLREQAVPRINGTLLDRPKLAGLVNEL